MAVALGWAIAAIGTGSVAVGATGGVEPPPGRTGGSVPEGADRAVPVEREAYAMGTRLVVRLDAATREAGHEVIDRILERIGEVEAILSTWRDDSELAALNRAPLGASRRLSAPLFEWLGDARAWSDETDGAFDPVLGALVDAWDLRGEGRTPDAAALDEARRRSGPGCFDLGSATRSATRICPGAWIDAGAFGKGAGLREAREVLRALGPAAGVASAVLDFGGQLLLVDLPGRAEGPEAPTWPIAIAHPGDRERPVFGLSVGEGSVATSAQSERTLKIDGVPRGHVLDPRSGTPVPAWGSVTVRADDPLVADALATALFTMGPTRGLAWLAGRPGIEALFLRIEKDAAGVVACGRASLVERLEALEPAARIGSPVGRGLVGCEAAPGHRSAGTASGGQDRRR